MAKSGAGASLLFLFLNVGGCGSEELRRQLSDLGAQLGLSASEEDGELQTDGHPCSSPLSFEEQLHERGLGIDDVDLGNGVDPAVLRAVAEGLVRIADQLENRVISQSVEQLMERLQGAPNQSWKDCLSEEVTIVLRGSLGPELNQLPMERMLLALTFTLVKGVCERAPHFLRGLFHAAVQYVDGMPFLY